MQSFESDFTYTEIKDSFKTSKRKRTVFNYQKIIILGLLCLITIILSVSVVLTKWDIHKLKSQFASLKEKNEFVTLQKNTIEKEIELLQKQNNEIKEKITFGEGYTIKLEQAIEKAEQDTKAILEKRKASSGLLVR